MKFRILLVLLLCSCAAPREADESASDSAAQQANQAAGGKAGVTAARAKLYPPHLYPVSPLSPQRLTLLPALERMPPDTAAMARAKCPACKSTYTTRTVFVEDTTRVEALRMELKQERKAHLAAKLLLQSTAEERDYWREMNRKKLWTLIAMAVFACLYIIFKILAARVRTAEQG